MLNDDESDEPEREARLESLGRTQYGRDQLAAN